MMYVYKCLYNFGNLHRQFLVQVERYRKTKKAQADLAEAIEKRDLGDLNKAIEEAIQLGLQGEDVIRATAIIEELAKYETTLQGVQAAISTLQSQAQSELGITEVDLDPIKAAIKKAEAEDIPQTERRIIAAKALLAKMHMQLVIQVQLKDALVSNVLEDLEEAVDAADDLNLNLETLHLAKTKLKAMLSRAGAQPEVDDNELEQQRKERRKRAGNPKYHFSKFSGLRSADDFAKGVLLNKKKVKDGMLKWQNTVITKPLTELDSSLHKAAIQIHKSLLGYMGDKQMSYPATLAQDILQKGYDTPEIRDEIYLQILKQLSFNMKAESIARGWHMLCLSAGTFPPSQAFQDYLVNFILEKETTKGAIQNYAKYCLRTLEGMLNSGATGFVPTIDEISAYTQRPPTLATIELVDGSVVADELPVPPDLTAGDVANICANFLEVKDPRISNFGIFVYDVPGEPDYLIQRPEDLPPSPYRDLPLTPRPLAATEYLGHVLVEKVRQRRAFKFVFKRKVFLPEEAGRSEDPVYDHLIYLQLEDETIMRGNLHFDQEDQVVQLAAFAAKIALGQDLEYRESYLEFLPPAWRDRSSLSYWKEKILQKCANARELQGDERVLKRRFIDIVSSHHLYGSHFFYVYKHTVNPPVAIKLPRELILAFNANGMHIFDQNQTEIQSYSFADIYKWGGSSSQFSLVLWNSTMKVTFDLIVTTAQAPDMAAIIMDYIRAIMAHQQSHEHPPPEPSPAKSLSERSSSDRSIFAA